MKEMPAAETPWRRVNQLLAPDERFFISRGEKTKILLAPRHSSQIAALFYFLNQEGVGFSLRDLDHQESTLIVTPRAFSQLHWHDHGVVEVGAGCTFSHLHSFLFEKKYEVAVEPPPASSNKEYIVEALIEGRVGGIHSRGESSTEQLVGCELVAWDGSQLRWGAPHRAASPGPALHKLVGAGGELPGVVTKIFLKCNPVPQKRLRLSWSFRSQAELWKQFQRLREFSSSWELLDVVLAGDLSAISFLFAQIAGQKEEMDLVVERCPGLEVASQEDKRGKMERFFQQERLQARDASGDSQIRPGEYLWLQEITSKRWMFKEI